MELWNMPDWVYRYGATAIVLVAVLLVDFNFRKDVYGRSDPLSFTLLNFSIVFVLSDTLLKFLRSFEQGTELTLKEFVGVIIFLVAYLVFQPFARRAHGDLIEAQRNNLSKYLTDLRRAIASSQSNAPASQANPQNRQLNQDSLWNAIEQLGKTALEPDLFNSNRTKKKKRIEYLSTVAALTSAEHVNPTEDEKKLLVQDKSITYYAGVIYCLAGTFGSISAIYFSRSAFSFIK